MIIHKTVKIKQKIQAGNATVSPSLNGGSLKITTKKKGKRDRNIPDNTAKSKSPFQSPFSNSKNNNNSNNNHADNNKKVDNSA